MGETKPVRRTWKRDTALWTRGPFTCRGRGKLFHGQSHGHWRHRCESALRMDLPSTGWV